MSTRTYCSTDKTTGATKRVAPTPPRTAHETDEARERRLGQQAAANRIRARKQPDGSWRVDSQRKVAGKPLAHYTVEAVADLGLVCDCPWGERHPGDLCSHIAQVRKQIDREARQTSNELARMAASYARFADGADARPARTPGERRQLAEAAMYELFGEVA